MASVVTSAAKTAHQLVASLLEKAQVKAGDKVPLNQTVKLAGAPASPHTLSLSGRNVIVRHLFRLLLPLLLRANARDDIYLFLN
jgi:hypothetical protein